MQNILPLNNYLNNPWYRIHCVPIITMDCVCIKENFVGHNNCSSFVAVFPCATDLKGCVRSIYMLLVC